MHEKEGFITEHPHREPQWLEFEKARALTGSAPRNRKSVMSWLRMPTSFGCPILTDWRFKCMRMLCVGVAKTRKRDGLARAYAILGFGCPGFCLVPEARTSMR